MIEKPQKKLLITILLTTLLISSTSAILSPSVNASQQSTEEKGLSILGDVLNLNLANYNITAKEGPQDAYKGVLPEENLHYTLESNGSKVDTLCTFTNGNLRLMYVLETEGSPITTKSVTKQLELGNATLQVVDVAKMAKRFLDDYQSYTGKSIYSEFSAMLNNVQDDINSTETVENVKFDINVSEVSTIFKWTYIANGIEAPDKCIAIGFKNGFLQYFIDNWALYKVGNTDVNLSEKEAIEIAMKSARAFSWNMSTETEDVVGITSFNVTSAMIWENMFASSLNVDNARNEDPLTLYPMRHVWVSLDKYYPGNVYGIEVYIWADTKDVAYIQERFSTLDPPVNLIASDNDYTVKTFDGQATLKSNSSAAGLIALPAIIIVMTGIVPAWFLFAKKKNLPKSSKIYQQFC